MHKQRNQQTNEDNGKWFKKPYKQENKITNQLEKEWTIELTE